MASEGPAPSGACLVRECQERDTRAIQAILAESPEAAFWSLQAIDDVLKQSWVSGFVSERGAEVTGFIVGRQAKLEAEILNLAVGVRDRRRGDGVALVTQLLSEFAQRDVQRVFLEVRESNARAIRFYGRLGFREIGRRIGYYREPPESALVLEKKLKIHSTSTE